MSSNDLQVFIWKSITKGGLLMEWYIAGFTVTLTILCVTEELDLA